MKIADIRIAALGAAATGIAIAIHMLLGHEGLTACAPELLGAAALAAAGTTAVSKIRTGL